MFTNHAAKKLFKQVEKIRCASSSGARPDGVLDNLDIPTPASLPVLGTRLDIWKAGSSKKLHEYIDGRHKELGPIYRESLGPVTGIFVADPEAIRSIFSQEGKYPVHIVPEAWVLFNKEYDYSRGLFFMDGPEWLTHRTKMNKLLLKGDLNWMEECCNIIIDDFINQLNGNLNEEVKNLDEMLYRTFLNVLIGLLLGSKGYKKHAELVKSSVKNLTRDIGKVFETTVKLQMLHANWAFKLGLPQWNRFEESMRTALTSTYKLIEDIEKKCEDESSLLMKMRNEDMSDDCIKAIVGDLILAAADTTAYTMQWMLYSVARNMDVQDKIRSELSNPDSTYTKYVLKETLRLYPVAPFLTRFLPHESVIAGYRVPKNSLIVMSIYTTGREEKYFKDAGKFVPERWDRGSDMQATAQASLPFAVGARSCIGRKLAEYELQKMLTEIVKNFRLKLSNTEEIQMVMKMVAVPSPSIRLKLDKI
nr:shadow [Henosepilachna vigintioctomaculata]